MKNKILLALAVLVLAFSLVGCGPSADQFVGKWKADSYITETYELKEDGNWSYEWNNLNLLITREYGTWVWNGDHTATLVDEDGDEFTAVKSSEYKNENDESRTSYLLIDDEKFWKVKEEVEDEE